MLEIVEAYDFMQRLWIFQELMDFSLTDVIDDMHEKYTEDCCKYILL